MELCYKYEKKMIEEKKLKSYDDLEKIFKELFTPKLISLKKYKFKFRVGDYYAIINNDIDFQNIINDLKSKENPIIYVVNEEEEDEDSSIVIPKNNSESYKKSKNKVDEQKLILEKIKQKKENLKYEEILMIININFSSIENELNKAEGSGELKANEYHSIKNFIQELKNDINEFKKNNVDLFILTIQILEKKLITSENKLKAFLDIKENDMKKLEELKEEKKKNLNYEEIINILKLDLTHKENESNEAEERITQFINKNIELIRKNKKLEEENNKLKSFQINYAKNKEELAKLREENEQLKANFNSIEKKLNEIELNYKGIINVLNIDLSYINNKSINLEERIVSFVKANIELINNNKKLKSNLDNIEKENKEKDNKIKILTDENAKLKEENKVKLEEKDNEIKILTDKNVKLKKEIQFTENKNKHLNNLKIENDNLKKVNEKLSIRLLLEEEGNKILTKIQNENNELNNQLKEQKNENQNLIKYNQKLSNKIKDSEKNHNEVLNRLIEVNQNLTTEKNNLLDEKKNLKISNENLNNDKAELIKINENKNEEIKTLKQNLNICENTIQSIKKRCKDKINEIDNNAKKRIKELEEIAFALNN